ncbi:MAG: cupredoxin domain-containing protein [Pseudomonadota bacterium]
MIIIVNLIGLLLIVCIIWWFWLAKAKTVHANTDIIRVEVKDGVYSPARIEVPADHPITLEFMRKDNSPCSEYVQFDQLFDKAQGPPFDKAQGPLNINKQLPLNTPYLIKLGKLKPGNYTFTCQMKMYVGELVVK